QGVTEAATSSIVRSLEGLQRATMGAIEQSKQTAAATVAEMMETHTMLRSDSTALFERLREANILLQEVLSGAHENMSSIEHTMATRVSEFVAAMTDLSSKTGATTSRWNNTSAISTRSPARCWATSPNSPTSSIRMVAPLLMLWRWWRAAIAAPRKRSRSGRRLSRR